MSSHVAVFLFSVAAFACSNQADRSSQHRKVDEHAAPVAKESCSGREACEAACKPCEAGACKATAAAACRELAAIRLAGQPPQFDVAAAARLYELACQTGDELFDDMRDRLDHRAAIGGRRRAGGAIPTGFELVFR